MRLNSQAFGSFIAGIIRARKKHNPDGKAETNLKVLGSREIKSIEPATIAKNVGTAIREMDPKI